MFYKEYNSKYYFRVGTLLWTCTMPKNIFIAPNIIQGCMGLVEIKINNVLMVLI